MTYKRFSPDADTFLVIRFKPVFGKTEFFNSYGCYQHLSAGGGNFRVDRDPGVSGIDSHKPASV
jgi:hypothetical protein